MKRIAILTAALTLAVAGCGSGAEAEPSPAVPAQSASGGPTTTAGGGDEGGSYTGDDLGTGTVFLGSDMFEGFRGSCAFTSTDPDQPSYAQPLQSEQVLVAVGVDNLDSGNEQKLNFKVFSTSSFSVDGAVSGKGTLDSLAASAGFTEVGAGVVTEVAFSGTLDDGTPMLAALVCLLQ